MSSLLVLAGYYCATFILVAVAFAAVDFFKSATRRRLKIIAVIAFGVTAYLIIITSPRIVCSIDSARIGQVHGVMGSVNGALSLYYADQTAWPQRLDDLSPKYMKDIPTNPWGGTYWYRADGQSYVIACPIMQSGKPGIAIYDARSGRVDNVF